MYLFGLNEAIFTAYFYIIIIEKKQMLPVQCCQYIYVCKIYMYILLPTNFSPPLGSTTAKQLMLQFQGS